MDSFENQHQKGSFHIVTYRDIFQKTIMEKESFSAKYQERSAVLKMFPGDMGTRKIQDNANVKIRNHFGEVVVRAISDPGCQQGFGYMPVSPYSNCLTNYDPGRATLPNFKRIKVEVEPTEEEITPISELVKLSEQKSELL